MAERDQLGAKLLREREARPAAAGARAEELAASRVRRLDPDSAVERGLHPLGGELLLGLLELLELLEPDDLADELGPLSLELLLRRVERDDRLTAREAAVREAAVREAAVREAAERGGREGERKGERESSRGEQREEREQSR